MDALGLETSEDWIIKVGGALALIYFCCLIGLCCKRYCCVANQVDAPDYRAKPNNMLYEQAEMMQIIALQRA